LAVRAQGVADMAATLTAALRNPRTSPAEATEATRHLLLLQAERAPCMEHADPIQLYLNTQAGFPHAAACFGCVWGVAMTARARALHGARRPHPALREHAGGPLTAAA
jgi:hypothetical protein